MQNFVVLGCLEVGEKFRAGGGGGGWGHFHCKKQCYTNLKLGWVRLRLGWAVTIYCMHIYMNIIAVGSHGLDV